MEIKREIFIFYFFCLKQMQVVSDNISHEHRKKIKRKKWKEDVKKREKLVPFPSPPPPYRLPPSQGKIDPLPPGIQ